MIVDILLLVLYALLLSVIMWPPLVAAGVITAIVGVPFQLPMLVTGLVGTSVFWCLTLIATALLTDADKGAFTFAAIFAGIYTPIVFVLAAIVSPRAYERKSWDRYFESRRIASE